MAFGWKVCRDHAVPESAWVIKWHETTKYKYGEWVFPYKLSSPLCVFNDILDAIRFRHKLVGNYIIVPCEYIPSMKYPCWIIDAIGGLPHGTILAEAVRIF